MLLITFSSPESTTYIDQFKNFEQKKFKKEEF